MATSKPMEEETGDKICLLPKKKIELEQVKSNTRRVFPLFADNWGGGGERALLPTLQLFRQGRKLLRVSRSLKLFRNIRVEMAGRSAQPPISSRHACMSMRRAVAKSSYQKQPSTGMACKRVFVKPGERQLSVARRARNCWHSFELEWQSAVGALQEVRKAHPEFQHRQEKTNLVTHA